jgi:HK97 family phage prohead protease
MNIERKYIDLKDLKVTDEGPGTIEGYRSVFSEIDEGGDLIVKGFFADSLTEYLEAGFSAHSHEWSFKEAVGFPVDAKEDDHGFWVKSQFHSTDDAQDIRKKAKERKDAGKKVGFSFGYSVTDKSYIEAKDYKEQLPLYVKADRLQANLIKAQKFDRIRILKKGEVIEDSIVTAPMNKLAMATAIKSNGKESKGMLADELAQTTPSTWEIESAFRRIIRKIAETAKNAPSIGESSFDWRAKVAEAVGEYGPTMQPLIISQIEEFLDGSDDEFYLKGISESESFESFESAESAIEKFVQKMKSNHGNRVKEGRMLSTSNRAKVQACMDKIMELHGELSGLMEMSEPKPKEKEVDVDALRTQSLRMQSLAIRALA